LEVLVLRSVIKSAFIACALLTAVAVAGCSGGRSVLPGVGSQFFGATPMVKGGLVKKLPAPPSPMIMAWLMTDGTVLTQNADNWNEFYIYAPDASGDYSDGTWKQVGSLQKGYAPDAAASDLLANGELVLIGGEYNNNPGGPSQNYPLQLTNQGAVYNPVTQKWTTLGHPKGWDWIGDSPSSVLPDGRLLLGDKLHTWDAYLDPSTLTWHKASSKGKADFNAEEGWTLLPNGTILTADVKNAPNTEIYNPSKHEWTSAGNTPNKLASKSPFKQCFKYGPKPQDCYQAPGEIGPAILRPDGTVFYTGSGESGSGYGDGYTDVYNPTSGWTAGPDFPNGDNAGDNYGILEPSGNVLIFGDSGDVYEYNGSTFSQVSGLYGIGPPILLPTGQVIMFAYNSVTLYNPTGSPKSSWAPTISSYPSSITAGQTYQVEGTQFNGLGQAMSFGDEYQNATNYPLVRITMDSSGNVYYAREHDVSTMAVATGSKTVSTSFDVPASIPSGAATLQVIANGIASQSVSVTVSGSKERR
jgi:hypothetical protein